MKGYEAVDEILASKRTHLVRVIQSLFDQSTPHSAAFVLRILGANCAERIGLRFDAAFTVGTADYGGFPQLANLGYLLAGGYLITPDDSVTFLAGIGRLRERSPRGLEALLVDDLAILGLADGLRRTQGHSPDKTGEDAIQWLLTIVEHPTSTRIWSSRLRDLAGDLLDNRGRLRISAPTTDMCTRALEVAMRQVWPEQFSGVPLPSWDDYGIILGELLRQPVDSGDLEKSVIALRATDLLVDQACSDLFPRTDKERLAVDGLSAVKMSLDRRADYEARRVIWLYVIVVLAVVALLALLNIRLTWATMEPWTYFGGIGVILCSLLFFARTAQELSLYSFYERIRDAKRRKLYRRVGFDISVYEKCV